MKFVRVRSYFENGEPTGAERLYPGNNQVKALERFRREYPEHKQCVCVAEPYDSEDERNKEHFKMMMKHQFGIIEM